jgi:hypothetical protein
VRRVERRRDGARERPALVVEDEELGVLRALEEDVSEVATDAWIDVVEVARAARGPVGGAEA